MMMLGLRLAAILLAVFAVFWGLGQADESGTLGKIIAYPTSKEGEKSAILNKSSISEFLSNSHSGQFCSF